MSLKEANEFFWGAFGGIMALVTLILLVLKFTNNFASDWIWVFCPLWVPLAFFTCLGICLAPFRIFGAIQHKRRQNAAISAALDAERDRQE